MLDKSLPHSLQLPYILLTAKIKRFRTMVFLKFVWMYQALIFGFRWVFLASHIFASFCLIAYLLRFPKKTWAFYRIYFDLNTFFSGKHVHVIVLRIFFCNFFQRSERSSISIWVRNSTTWLLSVQNSFEHICNVLLSVLQIVKSW